MKYRVQNIKSEDYCGPVDRSGKYIKDHSIIDKKHGQIFETTDINIAYTYKTIMEQENPERSFQVVEIE